MIIIGIDPGPEKSAFVEWCPKEEKIYNLAITTNEYLFLDFGYYKQYGHNLILAIEVPKIFGNKVWQQVIDTTFIAGKMVGAADLQYIKVAPCDWKKHIAGHRGANDQLVRQALMARFGPKGTKKNPGILYGLKTHLWDAFAIAVYAGDTYDT